MRIGPLGIWELLIILVVVLLIFGPRRLPEMAKGLGQSVREFRKGIRDIKNDSSDAETDKKPAAAPSESRAEPVAQERANGEATTSKTVAPDA